MSVGDSHDAGLCPLINQDAIYKRRDAIDTDMIESFSQTIDEMLRKFKSLSKTVSYKKVQRVNIINVQKEEDSILNLLNKISVQNFQRIENKILLKRTKRNCVGFVKQVLQYIDKTDTLSVPLSYDIIKSVYNQSDSRSQLEIANIFNDFTTRFIQQIDQSSQPYDVDETEGYLDFVERNANNTAAINRMHLVQVALKDSAPSFSLRITRRYLYRSLLNGLREVIGKCSPEKASENNSVYLVLEFFVVYINNKHWVTKEDYTSFLEEFETDAVKKKLTNKNKFRLLDIFDIARKETIPVSLPAASNKNTYHKSHFASNLRRFSSTWRNVSNPPVKTRLRPSTIPTESSAI